MTYIEYPDDCLTLQRWFLSQHWAVSLEEIQAIWCWHSTEQYCASWMMLPNEPGSYNEMLADWRDLPEDERQEWMR